MLASGVPVPAVSARLGHTSIRTTLDIYGHMIHGQDEEAVPKWEQYQLQNRASLSTGDMSAKLPTSCSRSFPRTISETPETQSSRARIPRYSENVGSSGH